MGSSKTTSQQQTSPYLQAREEWLERYGSYIKRAAQWRLFAFICLALVCMSVAGNIYQGTQLKIVPYIVAVDKLGKSVVVNRADAASLPSTRLIQAEIANAIVNWRTVTPDTALQAQMLARLASFATDAAKNVLKSWLEENNPYERAKERIVSVDIKGLPLPVSKDSWRVEWTETIRSRQGVTQSVTAYEATVTVRIAPPVSDAQIRANPGGVMFTNISFSKLLNQ